MTIKNYCAKEDWNQIHSQNSDMSYPAEGVIRILKGNFPELHIEKPLKGSVLDLGCGDGRHFPLYNELKLKAFGVEISNEICNIIKDNLDKRGVPFAKIEEGKLDSIPFESKFFDYLLSWNSCYYMSSSKNLNFSKHVTEMSRVIKSDGWLICSIPKKTSFIFKNSSIHENDKYRIINTDPWGGREGEIFRIFNSETEISDAFKKGFKHFSFSDIEMDWFGLNYHWHIFTAKAK